MATCEDTCSNLFNVMHFHTFIGLKVIVCHRTSGDKTDSFSFPQNHLVPQTVRLFRGNSSEIPPKHSELLGEITRFKTIQNPIAVLPRRFASPRPAVRSRSAAPDRRLARAAGSCEALRFWGSQKGRFSAVKRGGRPKASVWKGRTLCRR